MYVDITCTLKRLITMCSLFVTPSTNTYAYRAYIETLLSYGTDAKDTQLTGQLWHKDTATRMDAVDIDGGPTANARFLARRANIVRGRVVDMMGRLHVDLFVQDKFLINSVDVNIRLVRSKPAFALMAGGVNPDYKITIDNATLFAKKATLNPIVQMAHFYFYFYLAQPLGGAPVCCARNRKSFMQMVSGIRQEALLLSIGGALVCCMRNRMSLMHMVSGINPSAPNPYYYWGVAMPSSGSDDYIPQ